MYLNSLDLYVTVSAPPTVSASDRRPCPSQITRGDIR
jgi:hypothetical protein